MLRKLLYQNGRNGENGYFTVLHNSHLFRGVSDYVALEKICTYCTAPHYTIYSADLSALTFEAQVTEEQLAA